MKKTLSALFFTVIMLMSLTAFASAEDVTGNITVTDSAGKTVATYEIVTNNTSLDARDTIEKALRYARDNASPSDIYTVKLPRGEYCLYQSLNLYSNTVLDLSGSVITRAEGCGSMIRFGTSKDVVYGYEGYENVTIRNGTFDARHIGGSSLVRFAHASDVEISDVVFKNTTDVNHLLTFAACENVRIRDCQFRDMKITQSLSKFNCEAVQIDILKEGYFTYPAYDGTPTKNVSVTGCIFENVPRGLGTHSAMAGYYFDNMVFKNNTFKNIESYAIRVVNYINSTISDNVITDSGSGISCGTVTNAKLGNFFAPSEGMTVRSDMNVSISGNKISLKSNGDGDAAFGIRLIGKDIKNFKDKNGNTLTADCRISGVRVENNTITGSITHTSFNAIHINGARGSAYGKKSNVVIKNNKVTFGYKGKISNTVYGIKTENSENIYFYGNTVTDKKAVIHSLVTADENSGLYFEKNTLNGAKSFGIKLADTKKAKLTSNSISNTKSNGIYILNGCTSVDVKSNKIKSCSGYGIDVKDGQVNSISSNSIYACKKYSIYLTGKAKAKTVSSNYICGGKKTGIYLNKTASATTVTKNSIDVVSKSVDGICVNDKASVTNITSNKINAKTKKDSKKLKVKCKYGIRINSASCKIKKITGNTINQCDNTGIYIAKAKTKATVSKNTVKKAKYGIIYKKSKAKLSKNTFKSCSKVKTKVI